MTLPRHAFFHGRVVPYEEAKVGVLTHALNYGTGVFAGLRGYWNAEEQELFVFRPLEHFERFLESARLLDMTLPYTAEALTEALVELLRADLHREDCYARPLAFYADESIGVRLHNLTPEVSMVAMPYGRYIENDESLHATISSWRRVDDTMIPPRGKIAGAYVNSAFAKTDAQRAGFDEAIVLNQDGHVSEASAANVFLIRRGTAITPPVSDNVLEGITRRAVIELLSGAARDSGRGALGGSHRAHARGRDLSLRHGRADRRRHAPRPPADRHGTHGAASVLPEGPLLRRGPRKARRVSTVVPSRLRRRAGAGAGGSERVAGAVGRSALRGAPVQIFGN